MNAERKEKVREIIRRMKKIKPEVDDIRESIGAIIDDEETTEYEDFFLRSVYDDLDWASFWVVLQTAMDDYSDNFNEE